MNNLLRYFYCGAILLTIHASTYSMDGLSLSEQNELNQQAKKTFMGKNTENVQRKQTEQFFEAYKGTSLGMHCSKNPTSGCFLLMHHAISGNFPVPAMQRVIAADIKEVPVDKFPSMYEELWVELRRQNKPS